MRRIYLLVLAGILGSAGLYVSTSAPRVLAAQEGGARTARPGLGGARGVVKTTVEGQMQLVEGVMVQLISQRTGIRTTVYTDLNGEYEFPKLGDREAVNSFHQYGIQPEDVGTGLEIVATAPDGTVEAVAHRHAPQWGIMWHPERLPSDPRDVELLRAIFQKGTVRGPAVRGPAAQGGPLQRPRP